MSSQRELLTPQMAAYDTFLDRAATTWLPYLMYFHQVDYRSPTLNTDRFGFRLTAWPAGPAGPSTTVSPGSIPDSTEAVNLLVGSSVVFGVGATGDPATIASRLTARTPDTPWMNFGGRGFCSTQELLLFLLHRDLLPPIGEIVIVTGLNDLVLTGLPPSLKSEYGAFFFCGDYYSKMAELKTKYSGSKPPRRRRRSASILPTATWDGAELTTAERIREAVDRIAKNLDNWRPFADAARARLSCVLQPLAPWVRDEPAPQERELFAELDARESDFWRRLFGETADPEVGRDYAAAFARACEQRDLPFLDLSPAVAKAAAPDRWLFVDRAHFTDAGYDLLAQILATELGLG